VRQFRIVETVPNARSRHALEVGLGDAVRQPEIDVRAGEDEFVGQERPWIESRGGGGLGSAARQAR
jgi:hypothetical protein